MSKKPSKKPKPSVKILLKKMMRISKRTSKKPKSSKTSTNSSSNNESWLITLFRGIGGLISLTALILSYFSLNYNINQQVLREELAEVDKFYDVAASFPNPVEDYPILLVANMFNTKGEDHRAEVEEKNSMIRNKAFIKSHLNKDNPAFKDFDKEFELYSKKEDVIVDFVDVSYKYLVYSGMNQEQAGFSFHDSNKLEELEKQRGELESKFYKISVNSEGYYLQLNNYCQQEKNYYMIDIIAGLIIHF